MLHTFITFVYTLTSLSAIAINGEKYLKYVLVSDIETLSNDFNNSIQLAVPGKEGVYSKSQAKIILSDFFDNNAPKSASIESQGQSSNGAQFVVINVTCQKGAYKVSIFYRMNNSNSRIHEIKIQK